MLPVGRRRTKNLSLPAGVREHVLADDSKVWYWQPTSERERDERKKRRDEAIAKGLEPEPISITLGPAGSTEARTKWAVVSGYREMEEKTGTVEELINRFKYDAMEKRRNGKKRAAETIKSYNNVIPMILERFGAMRYGKTAIEAAHGKAIGPADIQRFVAEGGGALENISLAVLSLAFRHGIRIGLTTYNPCQGVLKNDTEPRTREPQEWEVECLRTLAKALMGLLIDFEDITAWRINEILGLQRYRLTADGILIQKSKGGKWEVWQWSPELRRIVADAMKLPGANIVPINKVTRLPYADRELFVFPSRRGKRFSYSGFDTAWQALKRRTNAALAAAPVIDVETLMPTGYTISIEDLHFHDLRSKAHDDAVDAGMNGASFIGDTREVAERHYSRRAVRRTPLR